MRSEDLIRQVVESSPGQWRKITCWGGRGGPSYKNQFTYYETPNGANGVLKVESHSSYAVLKENVAISLAWGMHCEDKFEEPWTSCFADSKSVWEFVDVFFNNTLVLRESFIVVDGGRCSLPLPDSRDELTVPTGYSSLVRLIDNLGLHDSRYDEYFSKARFSETDTPWPSDSY